MKRTTPYQNCRVTHPQTGETFYALCAEADKEDAGPAGYHVKARRLAMPESMINNIAQHDPYFTEVSFWAQAKDVELLADD